MNPIFPVARTLVLGLLSCTILLNCQSTGELSETKKLEYLAKSWGLVKYYHHSVGTGKINWDSVLLIHIDPIRSSESNEVFHETLQNLLKSPGNIVQSDDKTDCLSGDLENSVDFKWIQSNDLSVENRQILQSMKTDKVSFRNQYVSDSVQSRSLGYARFYEDPMVNADLGNAEIRLLGLFRYWNIIEYFFPTRNRQDCFTSFPG